MKALKHIEKIREYCDYLEKHINNVEKAWNEVKEKCKGEVFIFDDFRYFSLVDAIKDHDLSNVSKEEFIQYCNHFYPVETASEESKKGFDNAWKNHIKENDHHWENWTVSDNKYHPYFETHAIVHMIVDWLAMSYEFGDSPREYYESNKDEIKIPEKHISFMYKIFTLLEGGET